jgi:hypothetical protein
MKQVKTARGRVIDMAALAKANEDKIAVTPGNARMNARGDRLDNSGNVVQTVQSRARAQHNTTSAPEKRKLSDVPGNRDKKPAPKKTTKKADEPTVPQVIREEEKTRDDGTRYTEIEYDDGSMETIELDND